MRLSRGREMDRRILRLAIPNIISNITVPLLSIVDVGLAGRMDTADSIGAVAVASGVVNFVFWLFAFLRMGTTGFTAQAFGRSDVRAITRYLARGIAMAVVAALLLLIAAPLIERFGYLLASGQETIGREAREYIRIALWGAPAALLVYVFNGWYVGMQDTRVPMVVAIVSNMVNIGLSIFFVQGLDMRVGGLAAGTIAAQYVGLALLSGIAFFSLPTRTALFPRKQPDRYFGLRSIPAHRRRPFCSHRLARYGDPLFHLCVLCYGRDHCGGKCSADAALHPLLLLYGRIRLRRRSTYGTIHRCTPVGRIAPDDPSPFSHRDGRLPHGHLALSAVPGRFAFGAE